MKSSIRFDVDRAKALVAENNWTLDQWADAAGVSRPTIYAFLDGSPRVKNVTVDIIMKPFKLTAKAILLKDDDEATTTAATKSPKKKTDEALVTARR